MVSLVLLPGLDGTGLLLEDFAASFGPEVEVIIACYPPHVALGYDELEPIARAFLPQDRPFFLLAESFSGPIGISIAASSPPGLCGLILCCSFACNPFPLLPFLRPVVGWVPLAVLPMDLLSFLLLGRFASSAHRSALAKTLALVAPCAFRMRVRAALSVDVSSLLSRIKVPVLYLRASEDRIVFRPASELIVSLAPHTLVVEFSAPHFLLQIFPVAVAGKITEFMVVHQVSKHAGALK